MWRATSSVICFVFSLLSTEAFQPWAYLILVTGANELAQWPYFLICMMLFKTVVPRPEGNKPEGHYGGN